MGESNAIKEASVLEVHDVEGQKIVIVKEAVQKSFEDGGLVMGTQEEENKGGAEKLVCTASF